jgi:hypothetical protein
MKSITVYFSVIVCWLCCSDVSHGDRVWQHLHLEAL